ncbi:MAG TPA: DUF6600 domain-containing protein [Stellaceae bacterium]|nr:DUF6600 domain-containing protein [Stellaceae bacterium]
MKRVWVAAMRRVLYGLFALLVFAAGSASAQPAPSARVGRVSLATGALAFHMRGERAWSAAAANYPVASGATFWTAPNARAQMQLGPNTLGLDGGSTFDITTHDAATTRLGLWSGRLLLHIRAIDAGESVEIDLASGGVRLLAPGEYEIAAGGASAPSHVAVFAGRARFVGQGSDIAIAAGKMAVLRGENPVTAALVPASPDAFVAWCREHDYHQKRLAASSYLSPEMSGYAALDAYGRWATSPDYGEVWYPNDVPADWAPYRFGEWVWIAPWGWTWIDAAPWGFAPFHYGRWAYIGGRWGWVPGRFEPRPVYAPALVAFIGGAGVGWFPLGPGEAYWPSYTRNIDYIRRLNSGHVKDLDRLKPGPRGGPPREAVSAKFANRRFATVVPRQVFERAGRVDKARLKVEPAKLERAPVQIGPPKIAPVIVHPIARLPVAAKPVHPGVAKIGPPAPAALHPPGKPEKEQAVAPLPRVPAVANPAAMPPAKKVPPAAEQQKKAQDEALRQQQEKARAPEKLPAEKRASQPPPPQQQQQRAAQERAIQQRQAQERAAQQRAIEQQRAQQHPPTPKGPPPHPPEKGPPACGHPGEPPCPH